MHRHTLFVQGVFVFRKDKMATMLCSCGKIFLDFPEGENPKFCKCDIYYNCVPCDNLTKLTPLKSEIEWIKSIDRLPKKEMGVLICYMMGDDYEDEDDYEKDGAGEIEVCFAWAVHDQVSKKAFWVPRETLYGNNTFNAKYWMPLPSAPQE